MGVLVPNIWRNIYMSSFLPLIGKRISQTRWERPSWKQKQAGMIRVTIVGAVLSSSSFTTASAIRRILGIPEPFYRVKEVTSATKWRKITSPRTPMNRNGLWKQVEKYTKQLPSQKSKANTIWLLGHFVCFLAGYQQREPSVITKQKSKEMKRLLSVNRKYQVSRYTIMIS